MCGLKLVCRALIAHDYHVTPFVGVWIETGLMAQPLSRWKVTPFVGVWIETTDPGEPPADRNVTPFVGVWIETENSPSILVEYMSHPSWVCGLKH